MNHLLLFPPFFFFFFFAFGFPKKGVNSVRKTNKMGEDLVNKLEAPIVSLKEIISHTD